MTTLLLDADIFAFKASSACENVFDFRDEESDDDEELAVDGNLDAALETCQSLVEDIACQLKATRLIVCLTDEKNFRYDVYSDYKGNRKDTRKPSTLRAVKDFLAKTYETYQRPGLEADDCMGILSTHKTLIKGDRIIVSEDKDMQTIPGLLFNPRKDKKVRKVSQLDADRYFMQQTLIGDATDGYPGCPGHGKKSKLLAEIEAAESLKEAWGIVKGAYIKKGLTEKDAIVQARCARILRACDWDFTAKKPRLWTPPV